MNSRNFLRCIKRIARYQGGSDWKQTHSQLYMHPEKLDTLQKPMRERKTWKAQKEPTYK